MVQTINFEESRVKKCVKIPRLKDICPKEKSYYSDGTFFIIYKDDDKTYPNVAEIDGKISKLYRKVMIKCYTARKDTLDQIESVMFHNMNKRAIFADLVEELSKLHNTKNKKIEYVNIEYYKIEEIYEKYKNMLANPCSLYKFCYYWVTLCIALDFRVAESKPTVIHRSLVVKDAIAYLREQIKREDYCKSWNDVREKVDPSKMITNIEYIPVKGHEKDLNSDRFVNKKGKKIQVEPHGRLKITTE